jgi:hypothetical protein
VICRIDGIQVSTVFVGEFPGVSHVGEPFDHVGGGNAAKAAGVTVGGAGN